MNIQTHPLSSKNMIKALVTHIAIYLGTLHFQMLRVKPPHISIHVVSLG